MLKYSSPTSRSSRCSTLRGKFFLLTVSALLSTGLSAQATTYYWDTNGSTAGSSGSTTAPGTWNGTNLFFNTDSGGGAGTFIAAPTLADDVIFSAGTNNTAADTKSVSGNQTANSVTFAEGGGNFSVATGGGTLTLGTGSTTTTAGVNVSGVTSALAFSVPLTLGAATDTITNTNSTLATAITFTGAITGSSNLVINNNGTAATAFSSTSLATGNSGTITNSGTGSGALNITNGTSGTVGANVTSIIQNSSTSGTNITAGNGGFVGTLNSQAGMMAVTSTFFTSAVTLQLSGTGAMTFNHINFTAAGINGTGGTIYDSSLNPSSTRIITIGGSGTYTYGGVIGLQTGTAATSSVNTAVLMAGSGSQTFSGANPYTSTTTISSGTLIAGTNSLNGTAGAFGAATTAVTLGDANTTTNNSSPSLLIGGAFTLGRGVTVANQATTGTYTIGGSTDNASTISGIITANQNVTVSQVTTTGTNALNITGGITGATAASIKTITFAGPGAITLSTTGITTGAGTVGVSVTGGTITLNAASTYTGGTSLSGGTLLADAAGTGTTSSATGTAASALTMSGGTLGGIGRVLGTVTSTGGTINPGNIGTAGTTAAVGMLTVGALTLNTSSTAAFDIAGSASFDQLTSTGAVTLGGSTLNVTVGSGTTLPANEVITLVSGTSRTGTFAGIAEGQTVTFDGYNFVADYTATGFNLDVVAVPEPGSWSLVAGVMGLVLVGRRIFTNRGSNA